MAGRLEGKSKRQAALDAGHTPSMAVHVKERIESKPAVRELFASLLETAGVSDELLAKRIREGLNATVVSKETANAPREVLIDFEERREMVELVTRLKGLMPEGDSPKEQAPVQIQIIHVGG